MLAKSRHILLDPVNLTVGPQLPNLAPPLLAFTIPNILRPLAGWKRKMEVADSEAETEDDKEKKRSQLGDFLALLIHSPSECSSVGNVGIKRGMLT